LVAAIEDRERWESRKCAGSRDLGRSLLLDAAASARTLVKESASGGLEATDGSGNQGSRRKPPEARFPRCSGSFVLAPAATGQSEVHGDEWMGW
jgi:hypothetical protein